MSNKNANVEVDVEKHELTPHPPPPRGHSPGGHMGGNNSHISPHGVGNSSKPLESINDNDSDPPLSDTKETEDCDVGYITQIDKDGNIQQVPMKFEGEAEDEPNPLADFMSGKHNSLPKIFYSDLKKTSIIRTV